MTNELKDLKEYWSGMPEAPCSDTFKWVDANGFEHLMTFRGWSGEGVLKTVAAAIEHILEQGGIAPANRVAPPPPSQMVQERDEHSGLPVVDAEGQPRMVALPDGVAIYTVREVFHDKTKAGKDILKVTTVEEAPFISKKFGIGVFHAPSQYSDFHQWPIDGRYAPKPGAGHVLIRAPKDGGKYADVIEFRD
jgi:hypothetical protein